MATLQRGQRVVRSDMWTEEDQDGGSGYVGTVISISGHSIFQGLGCPFRGRVHVRWDIGEAAVYSVGFLGKYDLLLFDNAPAGVVHSYIVCDHCKEDPIAGIRWKCSHESCPDVNLCTRCYMADKHDVTHTFIRFVSPNKIGIKVGPRVGEASTVARGIFPGATVKRGKDWQGGNADGRSNKH
ncbi:E3 ubiquitin-protein ligase MIB2-like [Diadema setosum]|uniref:E3 ubiquitin-protein ligase MIB2-like n=1 Tax=Diadema setosum TaxID=31175 RepID=UPI003B3BE910